MPDMIRELTSSGLFLLAYCYCFGCFVSFHIIYIYLLNRATGMLSCWRYLATVRRAMG